MTSENSSNAAERFVQAVSDEELLDELDLLVANAARGEGQAVGAIAIGFGPMLLKGARRELGALRKEEAGDVVHDFLLALLEGKLKFPQIRAAALPWMKRAVRDIAREHTGADRPRGSQAQRVAGRAKGAAD